MLSNITNISTFKEIDKNLLLEIREYASLLVKVFPKNVDIKLFMDNIYVNFDVGQKLQLPSFIFKTYEELQKVYPRDRIITLLNQKATEILEINTFIIKSRKCGVKVWIFDQTFLNASIFFIQNTEDFNFKEDFYFKQAYKILHKYDKRFMMKLLEK